MMKTRTERKLLKRIEKKEFLVIYGAGAVGRQIAAWVQANNKEIYCFAITKKGRDFEQIDGIPVKEIQELQDKKERCFVIVATLENLHDAIGASLEQYGFPDVFFTKGHFLRDIGIVNVNGVVPEKKAAYYAKVNELAHRLFQKFSLRNIVVFESKEDYTDNCRALSEYVEKNLASRYQIVWLAKEPDNLRKRTRAKVVNRQRPTTLELLRLNYYIARASHIFFTHPGWLKEWKPEQKVVNLGHGNPFKKAIDQNEHGADCVLASGADGIPYRKKEYKKDIDVVVLGPPRNDWLFHPDKTVIDGYAEGTDYEKIIMCFPTYKQYDASYGRLNCLKMDSAEDNSFCLNTVNDREALEELNGFLRQRNVLLLCKEHYLQKKTTRENLSNIKYVTGNMLQERGQDVYQLMACADALITDFSSIFMDYLLLDRPIGFFCNTTEQYDRGFAMEHPDQYTAGEKLYNNEDLKRFVLQITEGQDDYREERKLARDLIFQYQDDQNCKRCAKYFGIHEG